MSSRLESLSYSRRVADLISTTPAIALYDAHPYRPIYTHMAALVADTALQAGVNYRTVVRPRVRRILNEFPKLSTVKTTLYALKTIPARELLDWRHPRKPTTFVDILETLRREDVNTCGDFQHWASRSSNRHSLLGIYGIGFKSVDYIACLAGVDVIPVDRHIYSLCRQVEVPWTDYQRVQTVFSHAADLLGIRRRVLDAAVWKWASDLAADRSTNERPLGSQLPLLFS